MVGILYPFIIGVMIIELLSFLFLSCSKPRGWQNTLVNWLVTSKAVQQCVQVQKYSVFAIVLMFTQSYYQSHKYKSELAQGNMTQVQIDEILIKKWFNERNLYMCFSSMVLAIAIILFIIQTQQYYKLQDSLEEKLEKERGIKRIELSKILKSKDQRISFIKLLDDSKNQDKSKEQSAKKSEPVKTDEQLQKESSLNSKKKQ